MYTIIQFCEVAKISRRLFEVLKVDAFLFLTKLLKNGSKDVEHKNSAHEILA